MLTAAEFLNTPTLRILPEQKATPVSMNTQKVRLCIREHNATGITSRRVSKLTGITHSVVIAVISNIRHDLDVVGVARGCEKLYVEKRAR